MSDQKEKAELLLQEMLSLADHDELPKHYWGPIDVKYFGNDTRCIAFYQPIDRDSSMVLSSQLWELDSISNEQITLIVNTEGGDVDSAFAIYDCIKGLRSPVVVVATGLCASGGLIILSAGDYRVATENCLFFYHQVVLSGFDIISTEQMKSLDDLYKHNQVKMDDLIKRKTKISKKDWEQNFQGATSYYFNAEQALKYSFIDQIEIPKKKSIKVSKLKENKNGK